MKINWSKFAAIVNTLGPTVLGLVNPALIPIAGKITHAITEAEQIKGATGEQKAQHVRNIVADAVTSANMAGAKIDAGAVDESIQEGINTVIAATKVVASTKSNVN